MYNKAQLYCNWMSNMCESVNIAEVLLELATTGPPLLSPKFEITKKCNRALDNLSLAAAFKALQNPSGKRKTRSRPQSSFYFYLFFFLKRQSPRVDPWPCLSDCITLRRVFIRGTPPEASPRSIIKSKVTCVPHYWPRVPTVWMSTKESPLLRHRLGYIPRKTPQGQVNSQLTPTDCQHKQQHSSQIGLRTWLSWSTGCLKYSSTAKHCQTDKWIN